MQELCGIERTTWTGYESGKSKPRLDDFVRIAELFHVAETDLLHLNLALGPVANSLPVSSDVTGIMQKLISCMEEKEALAKENADLKSSPAAYSYTQKQAELNEPSPSTPSKK